MPLAPQLHQTARLVHEEEPTVLTTEDIREDAIDMLTRHVNVLTQV